MMGNIVFVIYRPARQVLAAGMRTVVTGGGGGGGAVDSVNGQTGVVVLDAADVGADTAGTATTAAAAAVAAHTVLADPHPQYLTPAEGNVAYERVLTAGANVTIDRTNPSAPVINASGGGGGGAVDSVNGQTGVVVLDAADVGADVAGAATAAVAAHTAASDPHPQYLTPAEAASAYAPLAHVGSGGAAHANAIAAGAAGFMTGADKTKLDGIATGATQNSSDAFLLTRGNHTGTQTASTISDFASASRAQTEAELVAGTNVTITPSGSGATRQLTIAAAGGGGSTNLSTTTSTTTLTVNSDTGTDAVLPAATPSVAGVLTAADKTKLDGVAVGATANANTDSLAEGSTNKYFTELRVLATLMAGFTLVAGGTVLAADSLLVAVGKLQKQINDLFSGKQDTLVSGTNIKTVNGSTLLGAGDLVVSGGASLPAVQTFTGAKTLGLADINTYNVSQDATAQPVTLPAQATVAWTADAEIHLQQGAAGAVNITAAAGVSINGVTAGLFALAGIYAAATLKRTGADAWTLIGAPATTGAVGDWCNATGTANAIVLTPASAAVRASYAVGDQFRARIGTTNTGATTVNIAGLGVKTCVTITGAALPAGYIRTGADTELTYDGTNFIVGRIAEYGSNANGEFWRYADGALKAINPALGALDVNTASGTALFVSTTLATWTFPASFASGTKPIISGVAASASSRWIAAAAQTDTSASIRFVSGSQSTTTVAAMVEATGRWY